MPDNNARESYSTNGVSIHRRKLLAAMGVGLGGAIAGCTGESDPTTTNTSEADDNGSSGGSEASNVASPGGHLRYGYASGPQNKAPWGANTYQYIWGDYTHARLGYLNYDNTIEPYLAKSWESNSARDQWTYTLRENAVWPHSGNPITAHDVKASVEQVMLPDDRAPGATSQIGPVDSVEVIDDKTARFHLTTAQLDYPFYTGAGNTYIVPKEIIEDDFDAFKETDYGAGPFNSETFSPGNEYVLTKNNNFFLQDENGNQLPYLDKLTWSVVPDNVAMLNSLSDQRLDATQSIPPSLVEQAESQGVRVKSNTGGQMYPIVMNLDIEPFQDPRVRKALKHAIDKESLLQTTGGYATKAQNSPIAPIHSYHAEIDNPFGPGANLDRAKELLDEAGYGDGFELPPLIFSATNTNLRIPIATHFQEQCKKLNIEFELKQMNYSRWVSEFWNQEGNWMISNWFARPLEGLIFTYIFTSDATYNSTIGWQNDDFDAAVEAGLTATEEEEKAKQYREAQRILHLEGPWILPYFLDSVGAANEYVKDYEPHFQGNLHGHVQNDWLTSNAPQK